MNRIRMYKPDLDHESRWYAKGPSVGQKYYNGTLYPETRVESEEAAERDARMLEEAYWQGFRDAQLAIREALGLTT